MKNLHKIEEQLAKRYLLQLLKEMTSSAVQSMFFLEKNSFAMGVKVYKEVCT